MVLEKEYFETNENQSSFLSFKLGVTTQCLNILPARVMHCYAKQEKARIRKPTEQMTARCFTDQYLIHNDAL